MAKTDKTVIEELIKNAGITLPPNITIDEVQTKQTTMEMGLSGREVLGGYAYYVTFKIGTYRETIDFGVIEFTNNGTTPYLKHRGPQSLQSLLSRFNNFDNNNKENSNYLSTQAKALDYQTAIDENDKYFEIYKAYEELLKEFNSINNKVVLSKSLKQGFKVVLFSPIYPNFISSEHIKLVIISTKIKKLWDICKKNNYVVNSDNTASGFPCHISAYNIKDEINSSYINCNRFRTSTEETQIIEKGKSIPGYSYDNGEILLNEWSKSDKKHYIPNLLAPPKESAKWNQVFPYFGRGKNDEKLSKIKDYIDNSNDYGAPFGIEVSDKEFEQIKLGINIYNIIDNESNIDNFQGRYSCLIYDDCNFGFNLINEIGKSKQKIEEIEESIASTNEEKKRDLLAEAGMPPTLGDLFKTIMCHLETFTNMIFTCSQTIYNQVNDKERDPDKLGINLNDTDIVNYDVYSKKNGITPVTPFPGIYRKQDYYSSNKDSLHPLREQPQDDIKSMSWTGEIDKNLEQKMEETLLVESIYEKITSVYSSMLETAGEEPVASYNIMPYPILSTDLLYSTFPDYASESIDGLSAYLTFRYALLDLCANYKTPISNLNAIGKIDGFNFWKSLVVKYGSESNALTVLKKLNDVMGGIDKFRASAEDIMYPIFGSDDKFKTNGRYVFEQYKSTLSNVQGYDTNTNQFYEYIGSNSKTQRLLGTSENDAYISYRYAEDFLDTNFSDYSNPRSRTNKLIPIGINSFEDLKNRLTPKHEIQKYITFGIKNEKNDDYFIEKDIAIYPYPDVAIEKLPKSSDIKEKILNETMFKVFINDTNDKYGEEALKQVRDTIIDTYHLNSDETEIEFNEGGYKATIDIKDIKETLFNVKDDTFVKFYNETSGLTLYPSISYQNNGDIYFPTDKDAIMLPTEYKNGVDYINLYAKMSCDDNKLDFKYVKNAKSSIDVTPPTENGSLDELRVRQFTISVVRTPKIPLTTNAYTPSVFGTPYYYQLNDALHDNPLVCDRAKAFLFLHTLKYDNKNIYDDEGTTSMVRCSRERRVHDRIDRPTISPYGGLLLEGALIWRYRHWTKTSVDPISFIFKDYDNSDRTPNKNCGFLFDKDGVFSIEKDKFIETEKYLYKNLAISKYYNLYIQNTLEKMFIEFVNGDWQTIREKSELKNKENKCLSVSEFNAFVKAIKDFDGDIKSIWGVISGKTPFTYSPDSNDCDIDGYISNFVGNYISLGVCNGEYLWLHANEDIVFNSLVQKIYFSRILFYQTADNDVKNISYQCNINSLNKYLDGFGETLKGIYDANTSSVTDEPQQEDTTQLDKNVDLRIGIYMYIKNLWDRWLLHSNNMGDIVKDNPYSVKNYFCNFIFCDSFYRNMYNMVINMEHAAEMISNDSITDAPRSLHSYLGYIAQENKCMFLALPDTVDLGNPDIGVACKNMDSLFTPYTWREKNPIRHENTFLVMHVYTDSGVIGEQKEAAGEGFDLYSFNDGQNVSSMNNETKELFKYLMGDKEKNLRDIYKKNPNDPLFKLNMQKIRYGYNVPSFGVAFSRQNNSIFKAINVNMDTPMVTEVYSKTYEDIVNKASGNAAHITFYGQDLYPVFQNYSYQCEVEMMGNAQITPMMYIQLLNIPLFRGAYMITSVQHEMKPGYMTTKFKAVKMSKRCPRYVDSAYVETNGTYGGVSGGGSAGSGTYIDTSYNIDYGCSNMGDLNMEKGIQSGHDFKNDKMPIRAYDTQKSSRQCTGGVKSFLSGLCNGTPSKDSMGGGWYGYSSYLPFEKLFVTSGKQIYELYAERSVAKTDTPSGKIEFENWYKEQIPTKGDILFLSKNDIPPYYVPNNQYDYTAPEFSAHNTSNDDGTGHGCWFDGQNWMSDFRQNHAICYSSAKYWRLYRLKACNGNRVATSNIRENTQNQEKNEEVKKRGIEVMMRLHNEFSELTVAQAAGIAGVWGHESGGWNPNAYYEKGNSAFGLAQWEKIRTGGSETNHEGDFVLYLKREKTNEYEQIKNLGVNEIHEYFKTHYNTIESQIKFAKFEMTQIPQFKENSGNKCNVLGDVANYSTSRVHHTGNIMSVTAPYDSDHSKNTYEDNKNAIDDVVRRFLLGYEMQNQPPSPHAVHMEERCGYAKIAFDLAIKNKIWSEIL